MKRYRAILAAEFVIEAENVVQARRVATKIRSIGEACGARRPGPRDQHLTRYCVTRVSESVTVSRAPARAGGRDK